MSAWAGLHGLHGPNAPLATFSPTLAAPGSAPLADWWGRVHDSRVTWIKLLAEHHTPADAAVAHGWGLRVILRLPGEGVVHRESVDAALRAYRGSIDVLELGNEPVLAGLPGWIHAFYLEDSLLTNRSLARTYHVALCAPGWQAAQLPPDPHGDGLAQRLSVVYSGFEWIGVHAYDANTLASPSQIARVAAWAAAFPHAALLCTEYGIADRVLPGTVDEAASDDEKVRRYGAWLAALVGMPQMQGACAFLAGGTDTWAAFNDAANGYTPAGTNRYWLSPAAWAAFGAAAAGR